MKLCNCCRDELSKDYGKGLCKNCWEDNYGEFIDELEEEE